MVAFSGWSPFRSKTPDPPKIEHSIIEKQGQFQTLSSREIKDAEGHLKRMMIESKSAKEEVENRLSFAVIDTGIGIPRKEIPNLFDAFTQATNRPPGNSVRRVWEF